MTFRRVGVSPKPRVGVATRNGDGARRRLPRSGTVIELDQGVSAYFGGRCRTTFEGAGENDR